MKSISYLILLAYIIWPQVLLCQNPDPSNHSKNRYAISGKVSFSDGEEDVIGAQVYLDSIYIGTITNFSGDYIIENVKPGNYTLVAQYMGYEVSKKRIILNKNLVIDFSLKPSAITLESVSIVSDRLIDKASVSDISMIAAEIETYKGLQEDPVNVATLMPGITKGSGDLFSATQLYVRGGAPEENRFLYDNVTVYWPWYSGGIKSVFNIEVIDKLELLTGGFSAKYGNTMSSVMRVTTRDGNYQEFAGNFTFGFSGLQTTLEGPFVKDKVSGLISIRKTYLDLILGNSAEIPINNMLDGTYHIAWKLNEKHKISLSGLSSSEKMDFLAFDPQPGMPNEMNVKTVFNSESLQLQSMWSTHFYTNLSVYFSYNQSVFKIGNNLNMDLLGYELGFREDATYYLNKDHKLNFGVEAGTGMFRNKGNAALDPSESDMNDTNIVLHEFDIDFSSSTSAVYVSYSGDITSKLSITTGLRGDFMFYNDTYSNFSPRFATKYKILPKTHLRASYGYFHQFAGEEALEYNKDLKSNLCTHYILGIEQIFSNYYKGWVEAYYKDYKDLVVFNTVNNDYYNLEYTNLGTGFVKGAELFIMRKRGPLTNWVSYAYSVAKRQQSLYDKEYYFEYDRPHMLTLAAEYKITGQKAYVPHLIAAQFRYESGNPYTSVIGAVQTPVGWRQVKGEINSERNPAFHNLTLKIEWKYLDTDKIKMKAFCEIWNVYNRKNLLGRNYQYGTEFENNIKVNEYYSTSFLPAGGFRVEF